MREYNNISSEIDERLNERIHNVLSQSVYKNYKTFNFQTYDDKKMINKTERIF